MFSWNSLSSRPVGLSFLIHTGSNEDKCQKNSATDGEYEGHGVHLMMQLVSSLSINVHYILNTPTVWG